MAIFGRFDLRDPAKEKYGKPAISYPDNSILHPTLKETLNKRKDSTAGAWPYMTLSDRPGAEGCYLTRQASTKGDDDGANINMIFDRLPGVVKTKFPVDEQYGIVTKVQTQVVIAKENPPWVGEHPSGEFTLTANPSANETVTVGDVTYKFVTALTGAANEVLIAGTIAGSLFHLSSAINLDWGLGVNFGTGTVANPKAVSWFSQNTMVVVQIGGTTLPTTDTCAAGSWNASTAATLIFIEQQEIDVNRVYRVASRVVSLPPQVSYWVTKEISLPDSLSSLAIEWENGRSAGTATQGPESASASASTSNYVDGGLTTQMIKGFSGPAKALLTRTFSLTPPTSASDVSNPRVIKPSYGTVYIKTKGNNNSSCVGEFSASYSGGSRVGVKTQTIGPILTNGVTLSNATFTPAPNEITASAPDGQSIYPAVDVTSTAFGTAELVMPESTPPMLNSGESILQSVVVETWRLGIYMMETLEVLIP